MLCYIFLAVSAIAAGLIVWLVGIHWLWAIPICIGLFLLINPIHFGLLWLSTLFFPKKDQPIKKPLKGIYPVIQFHCDWLMTLLRIRIRFTGMERFPEEPFVLVSNHQSNFDPMVILAKVKHRKIAFISKPSNFKIPVAGSYVHNAGFLPIERDSVMSSMRTLKRASELMVQEQMIMGIYPEGTRSKSGELLPFKEGAFVLAKRAKAPVVVVSTHGTNQIAKRVPWRSAKIDLHVLDVIDAETVMALSYGDLTARVRDAIAKDLGQE